MHKHFWSDIGNVLVSLHHKTVKLAASLWILIIMALYLHWFSAMHPAVISISVQDLKNKNVLWHRSRSNWKEEALSFNCRKDRCLLHLVSPHWPTPDLHLRSRQEVSDVWAAMTWHSAPRVNVLRELGNAALCLSGLDREDKTETHEEEDRTINTHTQQTTATSGRETKQSPD